MTVTQSDTPRKRNERPDHEAKWRLFDAALFGAAPFGIDPNEDYQTYVCYEALRRLFDSGRTGRSAFAVIVQDATWAGTSRAPKRRQLNKALRALERAAADVMAEYSVDARATNARAVSAIDSHELKGTQKVPFAISASLPLAA